MVHLIPGGRIEHLEHGRIQQTLERMGTEGASGHAGCRKDCSEHQEVLGGRSLGHGITRTSTGSAAQAQPTGRSEI